ALTAAGVSASGTVKTSKATIDGVLIRVVLPPLGVRMADAGSRFPARAIRARSYGTGCGKDAHSRGRRDHIIPTPPCPFPAPLRALIMGGTFHRSTRRRP